MSSPARVPAIAAPVVRVSPWVRTNERTVTAAPSPIARTSGFQPDRRSGMRTRTVRAIVMARATTERTPRQPATAIVRTANARARPPMSGSRQRSMTEKVVVPSGWRSIETTTSSPTT